jgi:hypothetical protein
MDIEFDGGTGEVPGVSSGKGQISPQNPTGNASRIAPNILTERYDATFFSLTEQKNFFSLANSENASSLPLHSTEYHPGLDPILPSDTFVIPSFPHHHLRLSKGFRVKLSSNSNPGSFFICHGDFVRRWPSPFPVPDAGR